MAPVKVRSVAWGPVREVTPVTDRTTLRKHAALVDGMAEALGLDLEEAVLTGPDRSVEPLVDAVLRCTECSYPEHCSEWQGARTGPASKPPGYCRNIDFLARLARTGN